MNDDGDFDVVFHPAEGQDEDTEWAEWVAIENYLLDDKIGGDPISNMLRNRQAAIMQGRAQETPEISWLVDKREPEWIEIVPKIINPARRWILQIHRKKTVWSLRPRGYKRQLILCRHKNSL